MAQRLAGEPIVAEKHRTEGGVARAMRGEPALGGGVLAILLLRAILRDDEFRLKRDHAVMPGRHQRGGEHGVETLGFALARLVGLAAQPGRTLRAADLARAVILGAVERDEQPPVQAAEGVEAAIDAGQPVDRRGEQRMHQRRRGGIEHIADVFVGGQFGDAEQAGGVGAPVARLEPALMRQEGRALHEERREGGHADVGHPVVSRVRGAS